MILDTSLRILGYKIKQYGIETRSFRAANWPVDSGLRGASLD